MQFYIFHQKHILLSFFFLMTKQPMSFVHITYHICVCYLCVMLLIPVCNSSNLLYLIHNKSYWSVLYHTFLEFLFELILRLFRFDLFELFEQIVLILIIINTMFQMPLIFVDIGYLMCWLFCPLPLLVHPCWIVIWT